MPHAVRPPVTAFVAGATGYTGRGVVAALIDQGADTVVAHVRPDSSRLGHWREHFEALGARLDTTPWSLDAMTATLTTLQPTHVFSLLGTTRKRAAGEGRGAAEAYEAVDYGLTKLAIDAAVASGARPRFVYLSSAGVSEGARGAYLQARWRAESALRDSGLPWLVARPSFITGDREEARPAEHVGAIVADGLLGLGRLLGGSRLADRYQSMTGDELGTALVRLAVSDDLDDEALVDGVELRAALADQESARA